MGCHGYLGPIVLGVAGGGLPSIECLHTINYQVAVPVVTPAKCATSMGPMEEGQICAGGVAGKDSCQVRLQMYKYKSTC